MADRFENVINLTRLTDFYNKLKSTFLIKCVTTDGALKTSKFETLFNNKVSDNFLGTTGDTINALSANMGKKLNEEKLSSADFKIVKWNASNKVTYKGNTLTTVFVPIEIAGWEPIAIAGYSTSCGNAFPLDIHQEVDSSANYRKRIAMNIKLQQSSNYGAEGINISVLYVRQSVTPTTGSFSVPIDQQSKSVTYSYV